MRRFLLWLILALSIIPVRAAETEVRERIAAALAELAAPAPAAWLAIEDRLAAEGPEALPVLREAWRVEAPGVRRAVLAAAVTRLEWGWDPRTKITAWVSRLKTEDAPYALPEPPRHLGDAAVVRALPTLALYAASAGPDAPAPLRPHNLFAVGNDGTLQHLSTTEALEAFLRAQAPAVAENDETVVADLLAAWLGLSQALTPAGDVPFLVPPDGITAAYRTSMVASMNGWRGQARAVPPPGSAHTGDITVNITFDAAGKLNSIAEVRTVTGGE